MNPTQSKSATLGALLADGWRSELNYMSDAEAEAAQDLEAELTLDALCGVDLRARLIGRAVSQ
jgi:hypothetical protein